LKTSLVGDKANEWCAFARGVEEVGVVRLALARFVYSLHMATTVFVTWVWLLPWPVAWWVGAFFIPVMVLHWKIADVCILTTIEMALRGHPEAGSPEQGSFLVGLFGIFGIRITFETASGLWHVLHEPWPVSSPTVRDRVIACGAGLVRSSSASRISSS
jgi:hypothetical protein